MTPEGEFVRFRSCSSPSLAHCVALAVMLSNSAILWSQSEADGASSEYAVKAAFIFNFTQFITWPADAFTSDNAPFVIATVGTDPFAGGLEQAMAGKTANNRPIVVKHFAGPDDIGPCQVLFVPSAQDGALGAILSKVGKNPILTIGESQAVLDAGGCIRLFIKDNRMRFAIDPDIADAARLKVAAKLMKLAEIYRKQG
jgi:hypothetical protein